MPNNDTLSLIPAYLDKEQISLPLNPLGVKVIKLPESQDFTDVKSKDIIVFIFGFIFIKLIFDIDFQVFFFSQNSQNHFKRHKRIDYLCTV